MDSQRERVQAKLPEGQTGGIEHDDEWVRTSVEMDLAVVFGLED
jgi:hypothetical protein